MKKTIVKYGVISGIVTAILMFATVFWFSKAGYAHATSISYTCSVISFIPMFWGVRKYRDTVCNGYVSFGKALAASIAGGLLANLFYVAAWLLIYYNMPDVVAGINAYSIAQMKAAGMSQQNMAALLKQMQHVKEVYKNPFINAAATYSEPLFETLVLSLITALFVKKEPPKLSLN